MTHLAKPFTAIATSALLLSACATSLEADGRIDQTRADINDARSQGARASELSSAETYLADAAAAFSAGDADGYDRSLSLADAYVDLGEARAALETAQADNTALTAENTEVTAEAETCKGFLDAARGDLADAEVTILAMSLGASSVDETDAGLKLVLQNVTFASGSATLTSDATERLTALVGYLSDNSSVPVKIDGHTDSAGGDSANQTLSEARAQAVGTYLTSNGIEAGRITTEGFGETMPVASNDTAEGRAENRRVEITLLR